MSILNARSAPVVAGLLVLTACACGAPAAHAPDPTTGPTEEDPTHRTPGPSADYEVHEWGLIRGGPADSQRFGAIAPVAIEAMAVDKPVLYFHAPAPLTLRTVEITAGSGGTLLETWPLATLSAAGAHAAWTDVAIDPTDPCEISPLPGAAQAPCAGLPAGEVCETLSLGIVRVDDAACVRVGDHRERFLFYRGRATSFTPPLRFERTGAYEVIRVTNEGDAVIPGMLVRLSSDGGRVRTLAVSPPAPHQSIDVRADFDSDTAPVADRSADDESDDRTDMPALPPTGPGRQSLRESMRTIGLTESETDAFMRAWDGALFGPGRYALDTLSADLDPAPQDSFVYFLPAAALEDVAHLELDPPPSGGVRRAIAMWSVVRGTGASH